MFLTIATSYIGTTFTVDDTRPGAFPTLDILAIFCTNTVFPHPMMMSYGITFKFRRQKLC